MADGAHGFRVARRGHLDSDEVDFAPKVVELLSRAGEECSYLIDRDYPRDGTIAFVGNRYQLNARQRLLLARSVSGEVAKKKRASKRLSLDEMSGADVLVDGFNAIITLEVALSGSLVICGQDGSLRDLAGLRGTYHPIDKTPRAIELILDALEQYGAASADFLLDEPVSNSGRLRSLICELGADRGLDVDAETIQLVDQAMFGKSYVVSSDSTILDECESWFNLDASIVSGLDDAWRIDIHNVCQ